MKLRTRRLGWLVGIASTSVAFAQQEVATLRGAGANEWFGSSVAFVGDLDGDARPDFVVGSPGDNAAAGKVTVFSSRTLASLFVWSGGASGDHYGSALANAGDVDADGVDDVAVGAPRGIAWLNYASGGGYVEIRSGRTGVLVRSLSGPPNPRGFGAALAGGRDVDGDSIADLIVGAPGGASAFGAAYVFSGSTGTLVRTHVPPGPPSPFGPGPTLGFSVLFVGDVNGDGTSDYALGAPSVLSSLQSYVQMIDGATGASLWRTVIATTGGEEFGWSLALLGDVTGDGWPDLVASARQVGQYGPGIGRVRVVDGVNGAIVASYGQGSGGVAHSGYGFAVAAVGDLDGDGKSEFAVGRPGEEPDPIPYISSQPTRVCSFGAPTTLVTIPVAGDAVGAFGLALASGDANGDGLRDLLVGEPYDDVQGFASGSVYIYTFVRSPTVYCQAQVNSLGCTPQIASSGTPSASSGQAFTISASNVIFPTMGILFYGLAPNATPHLGGTLCVRQPLRRTDVQGSGCGGGGCGGPDCAGALTFDFNAYIASGADPALGAGDEVYAQYWSRDPLATQTTNLTDALAFFVHP